MSLWHNLLEWLRRVRARRRRRREALRRRKHSA
jgi:hypothetical protein